MAIMNYNDWFHEFHKYLTGIRKGHETFNDTKWKNMYQRYKTLINMEPSSVLLDEQPYNIVGNITGFQMLIDLMERSNYTFEDLDTSLAETYRMSLQNAMSKMLVNTHCVVAKYNYLDKKHVARDKYSHYFFVDVPFDQMHFGERDEFIRQRLHDFYETENKQFIPASRFLSTDLTSILKFTIICCTNGYMSDDWYVGIDEKGFRFKIGWRYAYDVDFTIYKLDGSRVLDFDIPITMLNKDNPVIRYSDMGIPNVSPEFVNSKCIIQVSDTVVRKEILIPPNFGQMTYNGCNIVRLQQKTRVDFERYKSETAHIRVYMIKYFNEVSGVFPAVNYRDMMGTQFVYDDKMNHVTNENGSRIHLQDTFVEEKLPICTPPISLNRTDSNISSFHTLKKCYGLIDTLKSYQDEFILIGQNCNRLPSTITGDTYDWYTKNVINPTKNLLSRITKSFEVYYNGALMTSLIEMEYIDMFSKLIVDLEQLSLSAPEFEAIQSKTFDMLYGDNYKLFLRKILIPINKPPFTTIGSIDVNFPNYYNSSSKDDYRVNRPISEQCFIAIEYNHDDDVPCWVFSTPKIKHFKGIDNVFYVDNALKGNEVFKFFFLYTDTENPSELYTERMSETEFMDFDEFVKEVDRHQGYVRYWYAENQLMKLSRIYYQKHDSSTEVSILTKLMKRKIEADTFFDYPSEMNYEFSNVTTDNIDDYDETSERAPFALNFLFYTMAMLSGNEDRLAHYFMHKLVDKKFYPRYADLKLSEINSDDLIKENINYSVIHIAPDTISNADKAVSVFPSYNTFTLYSGVQLPLDTLHNMHVPDSTFTAYPYVFNEIKSNEEYACVTTDGVEPEYYVKFAEYSHGVLTYYDDARIANMVSIYLSEVYNIINDLVTNYTSMWNARERINSLKNVIKRHYNKISSYVASRGGNFQPHYSITSTVASIFRSDHTTNPIYVLLNDMDEVIENILVQHYGNFPNYTIFTIVNQTLLRFQKVFDLTGFKDEAVRRLRRVYMQLKQMNNKMSLNAYKHWCEDLDIGILSSITNYYADNPNVLEPAQKEKLRVWCGYLTFMVIRILQENYFESMETLVSDLTDIGSIVGTHLSGLASYCDTVMQSHLFDLYILAPIRFEEPLILNRKPAYALLYISTDDSHLIEPYEGDKNRLAMVAHVDYDAISENSFQVLRIVPMCENAFRNGTVEMSTHIKFYTETGSEIEYVFKLLHLIKVSSSSDILKTFERYIGAQSIPMEIANVHERFDINTNNDVVNTRHAELHYELLSGNHFVPLTHFSEYCNPTRDESLQGPIDKLYLSCEQMNRLSVIDQQNRPEKMMFFKPCIVEHPLISDGETRGFNGKYFVGQTVYAYTIDGLTLFPMIITAIDHSEQRTAMELKVDEHNARWFRTIDTGVMTRYLTTYVTCFIVNDNIQNFLDEFSEYDGDFYTIPPLSTAPHVPSEYDDCYSLPGDPIFVETNSDYVYTRLNWIFHDEIPDRLSTVIDPKHHFVYIGSLSCYNENEFSINMINHDFNPFTNPELYPTLRDEPNDHSIWKAERAKFNTMLYEQNQLAHNITNQIRAKSYELPYAKSVSEKRKIENEIEHLKLRLDYTVGFIERLERYDFQLEKPSTWYNIISYDAAMVYISNGRAQLNRSFRPHIQDIPYVQTADNIHLRLYDWEHKCWIDPHSYYTTAVVENSARFSGDVTDASTKDVLTRMRVIFRQNQTYSSKKILVYFVYDHSDLYDDIILRPNIIQVKFRPVLSLNNVQTEPDKPYDRIRLRKHYDENESYYPLELLDVPSDFPVQNAIMFNRPSRSGLFTTGSPIRFCDMTVTINNHDYDYTNFDIYVEHPIKNITTDPDILVPTFAAQIVRQFDGFVANTYVTLACVNNNEDAEFNGMASSIMFNAFVSGTEEHPTIRVLESSVNGYVSANFVCYIVPSTEHPMSGGVITVSTSYNHTQLHHYGDWVKLEDITNWQGISGLYYRLIPEKVILVPKGISVDMSIAEVHLQNHYDLDTQHNVRIDNTGDEDLFTVYYDTETEVRYPVGNIMRNAYRERFTVDFIRNQQINTIRTNYLGVCRYTSQSIPQDGIIDLTGYLTTPLSRDRYEIWVNGRFITNPENLIILSPTSFQLRNLTSLKNLDVVELVDDVIDSSLFPKGNMYIDLYGNVFGSYHEILKRHANIVSESIRYQFNTNTKYKFDEYLPDDVRESNNIDIEPDILDNVSIDPETIVSYNQIHNIPKINGIPIYNLTSTSMGFVEYSNRQLLEKYDRVWKRERMNGICPLSHLSDYDILDRQIQRLHVKKLEDGYEIYTTGITDYCFTLYISDYQNGTIDDASHVLKIMPMLRSGVRIQIDNSFENKWLISTIPNTPPIQIK